VTGLWRHQQAALDFTLDHPATYLHMGMGTGKSRVVIEALERMAAQKVLILCPKAAVRNVWPGQFESWALRPWTVAAETKGTIARRMERMVRQSQHAKATGQPFAVVVNYDAIRSEDLERLIKRSAFEVVVFDEMHKLKSPNGKTAKAAQRIAYKIPRRIALSGTPMPHSAMDVFAQFRVLNSEIFGTSFVSFRNRYAVMGGYEGREVTGFKNMDDLTSRMGRITFQPEDVELDLPPEMHELRPIELGAKAMKAYQSLERDFIAEVEGGGIVDPQNALVRLLRLQQMTSGIAVVDEDVGPTVYRKEVVIDESKQTELREIFEDTGKEPIVVFGVFRRDIEVVRKAAYPERICELSGQADELSDWKAGKARVLAVQIASGAEGIDLTRARYAVYLSTGFNLGSYLQSEKRVHRPGQTRPVTYYHLVAKDTIDEKVYHALRERRNAVDAILADIKKNRRRDNE